MAMAVAFFNPSLSLARPRLSPFSPSPSSSETLILPRTNNILQYQHQHQKLISNTNLRLSASSSSSSSPFLRRSFHSSPDTAAGSRSKTIYEEEEDQIRRHKRGSEAEKDYPRTLKELIRVYKDAVRHRDEKTVSDIEAIISTMENEKITLLQKVAEISADIVSGKDNFLRLKADFDNFRKRSEKDRLTLTSNVQGDVIESLLPIVDSFEMAKQQIKPETEKEKQLDKSYQGIYKQFVEILRSLHVSVMQTVGQPFNPSLHEAIGREESQEFNEGIIIEEIRRGFLVGDKLVRPAMVKVSSGRKKAPTNAEKSIGKPSAAARTHEGTAPTRKWQIL